MKAPRKFDLQACPKDTQKQLELFILDELTPKSRDEALGKFLVGCKRAGFRSEPFNYREKIAESAVNPNEKITMLPIVACGKQDYFVDARLKQLRNVKNPHDFVDLKDEHLVQLKNILNKRLGENG